jgi:hypothetical protein
MDGPVWLGEALAAHKLKQSTARAYGNPAFASPSTMR